jgi:hypothetical protein
MNHALIFNLGTDKNGYTVRSVGAYRIASFLREHQWDVEVIDFFDTFEINELFNLLKSRVNKNTKFFGLSWLFPYYDNDLNLKLETIKVTYKTIPIISGSNAHLNMNYDAIDYHVYGYGENALLELLKYLFSNSNRPPFNINLNGHKTKYLDANKYYPSFPMPDLTVRYEKRDFLLKDEFLNTQMSRGCIFKCKFCNFPNIGIKDDYTRSVESIDEELRLNYDQWGIKNYVLADETFNDRTEKIIKYADAVEKLNFKPWFSAFMKPELMATRRGDWEHLVRMGVFGHFYGIESFNKETRKIIYKGYDADKMKAKVLEISNYFKSYNSNSLVTLSFIVGLPEETKETIKETKKWLIDNWKNDNTVVFALSLSKGLNERKSELDLTCQNYGYIEMTEHEVIEEIKKQSVFSQGLMTPTVLHWKNKHMNYLDACKIADDFFKSTHNASTKKPDIFGMGAFGIDGDVEDRIKFGNVDFIDISKRANEKIKNYRDKKLSL